MKNKYWVVQMANGTEIVFEALGDVHREGGGFNNPIKVKGTCMLGRDRSGQLVVMPWSPAIEKMCEDEVELNSDNFTIVSKATENMAKFVDTLWENVAKKIEQPRGRIEIAGAQDKLPSFEEYTKEQARLKGEAN